jgi:YD repeat-containing protein
VQRTIVSVCVLGLLPGALLAQEPELERALGSVTLAGDSLLGPVRSVEWRILLDGEEDRVIRTWYDRQGRRTERTQADHQAAQRSLYRYDEQGRRSGMDVESRLPSSAGPLLQRHSYLYDAHGRVAAQLIHHSAGGEATRHRYVRDEHGRLVELNYGGSSRVEYRYDTAGNRVVEALFNREGHEYARRELSYDAAGQLIERRIRTDDQHWVIRYRYDAEGRLAEAVTELVAGDPLRSWSHGPEAGREVHTWSDGGRTKETTSYKPDGTLRNRLVQRFDARGRLVEYTENGRGTVRWEYEDDHWGNWTRQCNLWSPTEGSRVVTTCMTREITYW